MGKVTLLDSKEKNHSNNFDQLVRDNSSSTLVKGGHLWLKLSTMLYSGMYCLFLQSISFPKQAPTKVFSHCGHLSFCPLEPPSWIPHGEPPDEIGRLLRVRNLCLLVPMVPIAQHSSRLRRSWTRKHNFGAKSLNGCFRAEIKPSCCLLACHRSDTMKAKKKKNINFGFDR